MEIIINKLNLGSGHHKLEGFVNVDSDPSTHPDICADAIAFLRDCENDSIHEIYAGHFLEHLSKSNALYFIELCFNRLAPGGKLGIVVPDMAAVFWKYVKSDPLVMDFGNGLKCTIANLDDVCKFFIYGKPEEPETMHHRWCWDQLTLASALYKKGFVNATPIDREKDPRLTIGTWFQTGTDAYKPMGAML